MGRWGQLEQEAEKALLGKATACKGLKWQEKRGQNETLGWLTVGVEVEREEEGAWKDWGLMCCDKDLSFILEITKVFKKGNNIFPCVREDRFLVLGYSVVVEGKVRRTESGKLA